MDKEDKQKKVIGVCQYHLCKKKTEVYQCKYCKDYFCKEHLKPKPPGLMRFRGTTIEDKIFMEEWHKPGGHPCIAYYDIWKKEKEDEEKRYSKALNKLLDSDTYKNNKLTKNSKENAKKNLIYLIAIILLLLLIISTVIIYKYFTNI